MKPIQNPLLYAEHLYKRHFGGDIWDVLKNKWGRKFTRANWTRVKKAGIASTYLALQIEKILGEEFINAEDMAGVENANNNQFKSECLIRKIKNESK